MQNRIDKASNSDEPGELPTLICGATTTFPPLPCFLLSQLTNPFQQRLIRLSPSDHHTSRFAASCPVKYIPSHARSRPCCAIQKAPFRFRGRVPTRVQAPTARLSTLLHKSVLLQQHPLTRLCFRKRKRCLFQGQVCWQRGSWRSCC